MTTSEHLPEIIRLQLRKPKSWNWELSTSKSSPHITLPIIQLYDYKGHLLIETKDNGETIRKTWQSSDMDSIQNADNAPETTLRQLKRCRSDTLNRNSHDNFSVGNGSINRKNRSRKQNNGIRSFDESLNNPKKKTFSNVVTENIGPTVQNENVIVGNERYRNEIFSNRLQKSLSAICGPTDNLLSPKSKSCEKRSLQSLKGCTDISEARRHRRSKSDDLFRRKLRYNSEESIKRAEIDGYKNFITPNILKYNAKEKAIKNKMMLDSKENVLLDFKTDNIEVNNIKSKKYKTRTSSAGTLVISEQESFHIGRRRCRAVGGTENSIGAQSEIGRENSKYGKRATAAVSGKYFTQANDQPAHSKHPLYPFSENLERADQLGELRKNLKARPINPSSTAGLFYSHSDVFPFREILNGKIDEKSNYNSNYGAAEAENPGGNAGNNAPINEKLTRKKRRRRVLRRKSDGSTSSSSKIERGSTTKGHLIEDHAAAALHLKDSGVGGGGCGASYLLQLVRRLSSSNTPIIKTGDYVNMGANVSRHSAKGLSGRRSQSSGSICNGGKGGRHPEGKICSSLPSFLDEREKNCASNNNDQEKHALDEVDRIPPLGGDGAPLHWKFSDNNQTTLCQDQGYGSERSPEEEYPPPLPDHDHHLQCHHHLEPHACYPFITPDSTFVVKLTKGSRGLGLSVTGGIDSAGSWPGLIRIKRLFPHQPAFCCGLLNVGDLLLEANGITLTGLTNYEALEVLRTTSNQVDLKVCRPPPDVLNCVSPISEVPPPPPRREPPNTLNLPPAIYTTPEDDYYHGEFEITLKKIQGSLGFTLRKEDESALGHYVRALVREPALTDGRIRAGDKIIAVNDVEICTMSHEQAVQFLRQCPEIVRLSLYRDSAQTPVATLSPSETSPGNSFSRKSHLRQEAVDMLNDIAGRKLIGASQDSYTRSLSPSTSPRRLRRQTCPSDTLPLPVYEQFHEGLLQNCAHPFDDDAFNSLFSVESDEGDKPSRPSSLDLYNPNQTPVAARKPRFNFSLAHNAYELNNLDPEVLDAPNLTYNLGMDDITNTEADTQEPASMPHIPTSNAKFSYKNPAYQSAHPQIGSDVTEPVPSVKPTIKIDDTNMKKWKNVVLEDEQHEIKPSRVIQQMPIKEEYEVLAIELNRGWNSRLGFSLQGAAGVTYVSAVHGDTVAAKDGRLKPGDRLIKVNDESIEHMSTSEIIDLLRIVRGPVCIVISRIKSNEDCSKINAEN